MGPGICRVRVACLSLFARSASSTPHRRPRCSPLCRSAPPNRSPKRTTLRGAQSQTCSLKTTAAPQSSARPAPRSRGGRAGPPVLGPQIRSMPCANATAWAVTGAGALRATDPPGLCLAFQNRHGFQVGEGATLGDCNDPATTEVAIAAGASGLMVHHASGLCVEGSIPPISNFFEGGPPCDESVPHVPGRGAIRTSRTSPSAPGSLR